MSVLRPATMAACKPAAAISAIRVPGGAPRKAGRVHPVRPCTMGLAPTDYAGPGLDLDGAGMKRREVR